MTKTNTELGYGIAIGMVMAAIILEVFGIAVYYAFG